jgi:hypothetical protein
VQDVEYNTGAAQHLTVVLTQLAERIATFSELRSRLNATKLETWKGHKRDEFLAGFTADQAALGRLRDRVLAMRARVDEATDEASAARHPRNAGAPDG